VHAIAALYDVSVRAIAADCGVRHVAATLARLSTVTPFACLRWQVLACPGKCR
jgi:hypothetical protein